MQRLRRLSLVVLAGIVACTPTSTVEDSMFYDCTVDGDASAGIQGAFQIITPAPAVSQPGASVTVKVKLVGIGNGGLCEKEIRWTTGPGNGTVVAASPLTADTDPPGGLGIGIAEATWTVPTGYSLPVSLAAEVVASNPTLQVVFTTTTGPPPAGIPTQVARNPGTFPEPQAGTAGLAVALPPSVKVLDHFNNPVVGPVTFTVTGGGGTLGSPVPVQSLQLTTGADGVATVPAWILGNPGVNTVQATVGSLQPVTFTANAATAPAPLTLAIHAGDLQSAVVNGTAAIDPAVLVRNAQGIGVGGVTITWSVVQGSGSFLPLLPVSGNSNNTTAEGIARLEYFAPTVAGTVKLRATVSSQHQVLPQFVEFTFTGLAP